MWHFIRCIGNDCLGKSRRRIMKRLGIFVFFDKEGFVGRYVEYLLKEIKRNVSDLYIVSNGELLIESKKKLQAFTEHVYVRENRGYDGGAYKDILLNIIEPSDYKNWDELLLLNDTFYGPFCSLSSIFEAMEPSNCDFWGLSVHGERERTDMYMYEHLQAYFLVVKSSLLWNEKFENFWREMKEATSFLSAVENFEVAFTKYFVDCGFSYDAFLNKTFLEKEYPKNAIDWTHFMPLELLKKNNFPIMKRKTLISQSPFLTDGLQIIDYIKTHTEYDIQMIWEDMLHKYNANQLIFNMNLLYLIHEDEKLYNISEKQQKTVIIVHINDVRIPEEVLGYLSKVCKMTNIIFLVENKEYIQKFKEKYEFAQIYAIDNKQKEFSFWKKVSNEFKYIGYIYLDSLCGRDYFATHMLIEMVFGNLVKSEQNLAGIYNLMMKEELLGLLLPPVNRYDESARYIWGRDAFWIKSECLRKLYGRKEGKDIIQLAEVLREFGYYSSIVQSDDYAKKELSRCYKMLEQINSRAVLQTPESYLEEFWFKYEEKYIYGTGFVSKKITDYLKLKGWDQFNGYIVTKKMEPLQRYQGKRVWEIGEISGSNVGIVLALSNKNVKEVIPILDKKDGIHYFLIRGMEMY